MPQLLRMLLLGIGASLCCLPPALAQTVTPTSGFGDVGTAVEGTSTYTITGGTQQLNTLFHSFEAFSPAAANVLFQLDTSQANVEFVIGRVTGSNDSFINGQLKLTGGNHPDLLLINPHGITFGGNASLSLPGAFTATTAEQVVFADALEFSATAPGIVPLLTISAPVGLQMGQSSGQLSVTDDGHNLTRRGFTPLNLTAVPAGLSVQSGNALTLVGRDVVLNGGLLSASSGDLNLAAIDQGQFSIVPDRTGSHISRISPVQLGRIQLQAESLLNISGPAGGGTVTLQGKDISVTGGSVVVDQNFGPQAGGRLRVFADDLFEVSGSAAVVSQLRTQTLGVGVGGSLDVQAANILLADGGTISSDNYGTSRAGNITVNSDQALKVTGAFVLDPTQLSSVATSTFGIGDTGNIAITAQNIAIEASASITSVTLGAGNGGQVAVTATEAIALHGGSPFAPSSIDSFTFGDGNAGNVVVTSPQLTVQEGAGIFSSTSAGGSGGRLTIDVEEALVVTGISGLGNAPSQTRIASSASSLGGTPLQAILGLPDVANGDSGDLLIAAGTLQLTDEAILSTSADGKGRTGTLTIDADALSLDRQAIIESITASGNGGTIELILADLLNLNNQSIIDAESSGTGDGGNIIIQSPVILGVGNSDIVASAVMGDGGNISITTEALLGLAFRSQLTEQSDINASSQFGINGTVEINAVVVDPGAAAATLPTTPVDADSQVAAECSSSGSNQFIASGRGGLPVAPTTIEGVNTHPWRDVRDLSASYSGEESESVRTAMRSYERDDIEATLSDVAVSREPVSHMPVEAVRWRLDAEGNIELWADSTVPEVRSAQVNCLASIMAGT